VRTDRGERHDVRRWVDDGAPARQVVGCATRWSRYEHAIPLHNSEKDVVDVYVEAAHEFSVASCDGDLIEGVADGRLHRLASLAVNEHALVDG